MGRYSLGSVLVGNFFLLPLMYTEKLSGNERRVRELFFACDVPIPASPSLLTEIAPGKHIIVRRDSGSLTL